MSTPQANRYSDQGRMTTLYGFLAPDAIFLPSCSKNGCRFGFAFGFARCNMDVERRVTCAKPGSHGLTGAA